MVSTINSKWVVALAVMAAGCGGQVSEPTHTAPYNITQAELPIWLQQPLIAGEFDQQIDHDQANNDATDAGSPGTFKQRYWYTTEFAQGPNSPVLFYLCGEAPCSSDYAYSMGDSAKALGAAIVVLEHRYYGESLPFPQLTLSAMKYLTIHNALEDAAAFETFALTTLPLKGKWIAVGGSYPGMLAAFFRLKHPELVVGAWASSAPVDIVLSFTGYDAIAANALGPSCTPLFRQALDAAATAYDDPTQRDALATSLFGQPLGDLPKADFMQYISNIAEEAAQYGNTHGLCEALQQEATQPLQGLIGYRSPPLVPDPPSGGDGGTSSDGGVAADGGVLASPAPHLGMPALQAPTSDNFLGAEWFYQVCTEVGFYQIQNTDPADSVMSSFATEGYWNDQCLQYVGTSPQIDVSRANYYDPLVQGLASNILFVNGSLDPWSSLSFKDPSAAPLGLTPFVVQLGSHCEDLQNLAPESVLGVFQAHKLFHDLAVTWLAE